MGPLRASDEEPRGSLGSRGSGEAAKTLLAERRRSRRNRCIAASLATVTSLFALAGWGWLVLVVAPPAFQAPAQFTLIPAILATALGTYFPLYQRREGRNLMETDEALRAIGARAELEARAASRKLERERELLPAEARRMVMGFAVAFGVILGLLGALSQLLGPELVSSFGVLGGTLAWPFLGIWFGRPQRMGQPRRAKVRRSEERRRGA